MWLVGAAAALGGYVICFALVSHWASPQIDSLPKCVLALGWFICLASLLTANVDIYQTLRLEQQGIPLIGLWRTFYWGSFFLGYIFFVVLGEQRPHEKSTPLEVWVRFYRRRLRVFAAGAATVVVVTLTLAFRGIVPWRSLDALPKLATNIVGLLLIVVILGYSLPELPRKLHYRFEPQAELEHVLTKIALSRRRLEEQEYALEHAAGVLTLRFGREGNESSLAVLRSVVKRLEISFEGAGLHDAEAPNTETEADIDLTTFIDDAEEYQRQLRKVEWRMKHAKLLMQHVEAREGGPMRVVYTLLRPVLFRMLFFLTSALSLVLLLLIVANFIDFPRGYIVTFLANCPPPLFFVSLNAYLGYFTLLVIFGVQRLKIQRFRGLAPGATGLPALLHFTRNVLRMVMPMIVNLLQVLQLEETQFSLVMGRPHFLPLMGDQLLRAFPALLLVLLALRLTDAYSKAMRLLGLEDPPFESQSDKASLIAAARKTVRQSSNGWPTQGV